MCQGSCRHVDTETMEAFMPFASDAQLDLQASEALAVLVTQLAVCPFALQYRE